MHTNKLTDHERLVLLGKVPAVSVFGGGFRVDEIGQITDHRITLGAVITKTPDFLLDPRCKDVLTELGKDVLTTVVVDTMIENIARCN